MATHSARGTAPATGVAKAHRILALIFLAAGVVQFFLAGLGAFGSDAGWDPHEAVGHLMSYVAVIILILAAVGRREALPASALLLVLVIVQIVLAVIGSDAPVLAALHPVNALLVLGVASLAAAGSALPFGGGRSPAARA